MHPTPNGVRPPRTRGPLPTTMARMAETIVEALKNRGRVERDDFARAGFTQDEIDAFGEAAMMAARRDKRVDTILAEAA